jgi:hypothetical protein
MAGMVAPTWPYMAMSGLCNFGDVAHHSLILIPL